MLPKLSFAVSVIGSDPRVPSVSVSVAGRRSPGPACPDDQARRAGAVDRAAAARSDMFADRSPLLSLSVTVKTSPEVLPVSVTTTPVIGSVRSTSIVCAGVVSIGAVFTVTVNRLCVAALLPKPSVAFTVMVSVPGVLSVSLSVPRSVLTSPSVPLMVSSCCRCSTRRPTRRHRQHARGIVQR